VRKRETHIILETPRLALRQFANDADNLLDLNGDPEVTRYPTGSAPGPPRDHAP
jgi:hypothetical protein